MTNKDKAELEKLLERMRGGGLGKKVSIDNKLIWQLGGYEDDESEYSFVIETLVDFIDQHTNKVLDEVAKQLEMTILFYEKELQSTGVEDDYIESLESRIRAYIRHEIKKERHES